MVEGANKLEKFNSILADVKRACSKGNAYQIPIIILEHADVFIPDVNRKVKVAFCENFLNTYILYMVMGATSLRLVVEDGYDLKIVKVIIESPIANLERVLLACSNRSGMWSCS